MQKSFVLDSKDNIVINSIGTAVPDLPAGIFLVSDSAGTVLLRKDGLEVSTDFRSVFERIQTPRNYDFFTFHDSSTGDFAVVHREVLRRIAGDVFQESLFTVKTEEEAGKFSRSSLVRQIAMEYLGLA